MKKNSGFTLIELLAVIVILAIIMVIATPMIMKTIEDAKIGAFRNTAYGIIKSAELEHSKMATKGEKISEITFTYTDGNETSSIPGKKLDYKGTKPQSGTVKINSKGEVELVIHDGTYCAKKEYGDTEVVVTKVTKEECLDGEIAPKFVKVANGFNYSLLLTENGEVYVDTVSDYYLHFRTNLSENRISKMVNLLYAADDFITLVGREGYSKEELREFFMNNNSELLTYFYIFYSYPEPFYTAEFEYTQADDYILDLYNKYPNIDEMINFILSDSNFITFRENVTDQLLNLIYDYDGPTMYYRSKLNIEGVKDIYIVGWDTAFFIMNNGDLYAVGNRPGLGKGSNSEYPYTVIAWEPTKVAGLSNVKKVVGDNNDIYAITENGDVYGWGYNYNGILGTETSDFVYTPTKISGLSNVKDIVMTYETRFAIMNYGTVKGWGYTRGGQVPIQGQGNIIKIPTTIPSLTNVKKIYSAPNSGEFSYALHENNSVTVWGGNELGQLGLGHHNDVTTPTVHPILTNVKDIIIGEEHVIILKNDGSVYATGYNGYGAFGIGNDDVTYITPTKITDIKASKLAGNTTHTVLIDNNGNVYAAGFNYENEFGAELPEIIKTFTKLSNFTNVDDVFFESMVYYGLLGNRAVYFINNNVLSLGNSISYATLLSN